MSSFDEERFRQRVTDMSNDELKALMTINAKNFVPEAINIASQEIDKRGLADDLQKVHFDVYLNHSGFAGRLILLDEQLLYLSTGMKAAPGGGRGIAGLIAAETRTAERSVAAHNLDFSSLDNEGSWIYYLDQIKSCETKSSFLSGKELILVTEEENGNRIRGVIKCNELSKEEFLGLAEKIISVKAQFERSAGSNKDQ